MPTVLEIINPLNNNILRCKFGEKNVILGLINGKNMRGIAVPLTSVLVKSPAYDLFVKNALNNGFTQDNIDNIRMSVMMKLLSNTVDETRELVASDKDEYGDLIPASNGTVNYICDRLDLPDNIRDQLLIS